MMDRSGEGISLGMRNIVLLIISAIILGIIILMSIALISLFGDQHEESYRARRNMHLLADRIESTIKYGLEPPEASVVLDMPPGYNIVMYSYNGAVHGDDKDMFSDIDMGDKPQQCKSRFFADSVCLCVVDGANRHHADKYALSDVVGCRKLSGAKEIQFNSGTTKATIQEGVDNYFIDIKGTAVTISLDPINRPWEVGKGNMDCSQQMTVRGDPIEYAEKVKDYCHGKPMVREEYIGTGISVGGIYFCYRCYQLDKKGTCKLDTYDDPVAPVAFDYYCP
ncbi:hypothetical protein GOV11_00165 [Candidatus Woesearchaeota archaeon]|nr:hypothetical protein [Candidatus Woesearchaeota archaeon]